LVTTPQEPRWFEKQLLSISWCARAQKLTRVDNGHPLANFNVSYSSELVRNLLVEATLKDGKRNIEFIAMAKPATRR
jgi:hypothetical protein